MTDAFPSITDRDLERVTGGFLEEGDSGGWGDVETETMTTADPGDGEQSDYI